MKPKHIRHLYSRGGFGINPKDFSKLQQKSKKQLVNQLFETSKNSTPVKIASFNDIKKYKDFRNLNADEKRELQKLNRKKIIELNVAWIDRIFNPNEILRERMTLFWANHFVCKAQNIFHIQQFNNILRKNALGNFGDFVKEVSKSASMIKYLNAKQNKKQSPNENFARELMELFTLGVGNYSEKDIKESAKAFTGWNHKLNGDFILRERHHDFGEKEFFNKKGNFNGEDIIDIILEQKQCAQFICEKIYRYFVNTTINTNHINEMVRVFYPNYNIEKLMRFIFMSKWFYNEENIGTKIKSPIDLLAGINNVAPYKFKSKKQLLYLQKRLGQQLLNPINVAGWEGGQSWIDTNTLMLRLKLPAILFNNAVISLAGISEFEDTYEQYLKNRKRRKSYLKIEVNETEFNSNYSNLNALQIQQHLLSGKLSEDAKVLLSNIAFDKPKDYCLQLMSLPEYQLC
ncbi:Uncharacterized conserved protein, DUF1800 family [Lutibacter oricola]|uniref:Uncharacterized conserved protein, DUF1800 family n=1 Tax=Lutibacter oricola TaxID=762486 RepID=A0A1H2T6D7_9FLAO|nr:DUF1800 domain-containing protein [Lutibacter oricola]SDW39442.1 Uncharacterized conserved protein, DUF1800 family [Lutibacter oricola]